MSPFIEINGRVYVVIGWEPDILERDRYELRLFTDNKLQRYRKFKRESDIELCVKYVGREVAAPFLPVSSLKRHFSL